MKRKRERERIPRASASFDTPSLLPLLDPFLIEKWESPALADAEALAFRKKFRSSGRGEARMFTWGLQWDPHIQMNPN